MLRITIYDKNDFVPAFNEDDYENFKLQDVLNYLKSWEHIQMRNADVALLKIDDFYQVAKNRWGEIGEILEEKDMMEFINDLYDRMNSALRNEKEINQK